MNTVLLHFSKLNVTLHLSECSLNFENDDYVYLSKLGRHTKEGAFVCCRVTFGDQ